MWRRPVAGHVGRISVRLLQQRRYVGCLEHCRHRAWMHRLVQFHIPQERRRNLSANESVSFYLCFMLLLMTS